MSSHDEFVVAKVQIDRGLTLENKDGCINPDVCFCRGYEIGVEGGNS